MNTPAEGDDVLHELEMDVDAELTVVESSSPESEADRPVAEWRFDPADVQRYDTELRSLLHAAETLEDETDGKPRPGRDIGTSPLQKGVNP